VRRSENRHSFVLRIWWEEGARLPAWRGWVQHAPSGKARYFSNLLALLAFVEKHTGPLAQSAREGLENSAERGEEEEHLEAQH